MAPPVTLDGTAMRSVSVPTTVEPAAAEPSAAPEPTSEPPPPTVPASEPVDAPPQPTSLDRCKKNGRDVCRAKIIGGAVLTAIGVAAFGVGAGLASISRQTIDDDPSFYRTYQPAGSILVGGGVAFVVTGAFLIADAVRTKRGPRARKGKRAR
jgi:hypothetical protein